MPIPPDPDNLNEDRANWARAALDAFMEETGADPEDALADLLADLMHLCDRTGEFGRFTYSFARASDNYLEETRDVTTFRLENPTCPTP